jgi:hypothetical protein
MSVIRLKAVAGATLFAAIVYAGSGYAAPPGSEPACEAALGSVTQEWRAINFSTPSKPAQSVVAGRFGHETSGARLSGMQEALRRARDDCNAGRDEEALKNLVTLRTLLASPRE